MKEYLKRLLKKAGYKLMRRHHHSLLDDNPFIAAMSQTNTQKVIFFDVGVNEGQTIKKLLEVNCEASIYGFEPSENSFQKCEKKYRKFPNVKIYNQALGRISGYQNFHQYSWSAMDSFLTRAYGTAVITSTYPVKVSTLDEIFASEGIPYINLLKTDTEGYELEVLKGATKVLQQHKIHFVLVEIFFNENYHGQASFGDIYNFLIQNDFELVRFYDISYTKEALASKTDALFKCRFFGDYS